MLCASWLVDPGAGGEIHRLPLREGRELGLGYTFLKVRLPASRMGQLIIPITRDGHKTIANINFREVSVIHCGFADASTIFVPAIR